VTIVSAADRAARFPLGAAATIEALDADPHALLARLRAQEPVSHVPAIGGWLVTRRDLAMQVMRDPEFFTVDDPRFTTGQVVGPSMLTLDGAEHRRNRDPFTAPFKLAAVRERFGALVADESARLVDAFAPDGKAEIRRALAGPLAARIATYALGFEDADVGRVLGWYDQIVASVTELSAGRPATEAGAAAYAQLAAAIGPALDRDAAASRVAHAATEAAGALPRERVISNAAVLLFGGIETTEGMIANAVAHLLRHPDALAAVRADRTLLPNAIEESLRLEPAAAVIDRYATADVTLAGAPIAKGDLVQLSIAAANRDPAVFADPDRFDIARENARLHVAFAHGPHVCIGMHLARMEAHTAIGALLDRLGDDLRLDPDAGPPQPRGLVFRKPPEVPALWTPDGRAAPGA
jgi:cytochrome P450